MILVGLDLLLSFGDFVIVLLLLLCFGFGFGFVVSSLLSHFSIIILFTLLQSNSYHLNLTEKCVDVLLFALVVVFGLRHYECSMLLLVTLLTVDIVDIVDC